MHKILSAVISSAILLTTFPAAAQWTNGQLSEYVVGQSDFISNTNTPINSSTLSSCYGVAVDVANGKLYAADTIRNRVLRFSYPIAGNQPSAEIVFGQANDTDSSANAGVAASASTLSTPRGIALDPSGRLWVADSANNRVLAYDNAHSIASNMPAANQVLGQNLMSDVGAGSGLNRMNAPYGLALDTTGSLYVCDRSNHRVLRFDGAAGLANGSSAANLFGFTGVSAVTISGLNSPTDVECIGSSLYIADTGANRVLRHDNAAGKATSANADRVLGQTLFTTAVAALGISSFNAPTGLAADMTGRLYVADSTNNRIVTFNNANSLLDGAAATNVLGKANFVTGTADLTQDRCTSPWAVAVDSIGGKLISSESTNRRVLVWDASSGLPVSLSGFAIE